MALLTGNLLPASFRGVPFVVENGDIGGGRRIALHQYPQREVPWAEDMGRAARRFRLQGFVVDSDMLFAGGPIAFQRATLIAAFERKGPGTLTHPTLGVLSVSVASFSVAEGLDAESWSSVAVEFVEAGKQQFPMSLLSTASGLVSAANLCAAALVADAVRAVAVASQKGGTGAQLTATAASYASATIALGTDATALYRLAAQLPGNYGRFAAGGNAGVSGSNPTVYDTDTTVTDLASDASAARAAISAAGVALGVAIAASALTDVTTVAQAARDLVGALVAACADPADAVRLLEHLAAWASPRPESVTPIGAAFARAIRRAAAAEMATACGAYQPTSSNDAAALIARIGGLLDTIATEAADAGEDASFKAVRAVRAAVVQDLRKRGGTLASVRTFNPGASLPALVLAQRFYTDPSRASELVTEADPIHPLFMPGTFQGIAT